MRKDASKMAELAQRSARLRVRLLALALIASLASAALGCGEDENDGPAPIVGSLRFVVEPAPTGDAYAFTPIDPQGGAGAVTVEVLDEDGLLIPDATDEITISLEPSDNDLILHATGISDPNTTDLESRLLELIDPTVPALRYVLEKNWRIDAPTSLAYDASTDAYLVNNRRIHNLYRGDVRTGETTLVGNGTTIEVAGMAFEVDGDERLFAVKNRAAPEPIAALYTIDPATGEETVLGQLTVLDSDGSASQAGIGYFSGLAVDPTDGTIYASAAMTGVQLPGAPGHVLLTIDPETLEATIVADSTMDYYVSSLATGQDGTLYAVRALKQGDPRVEVGEPELRTVDKGTGKLAGTALLSLPNGDDGDALATVPPRLYGTLTATAVNGVATFDELKIDAIGSDYVLTASASGRAPASSSAFAVDDPAALAGDVDLTESAITVSETDGSFDVTVAVVPPPTIDVIVTAGVGGTASDVNETSPDTDLDYLDYFQLVIPAGDADGQVTRTITLVDDADVEGDETVVFELLDASLATGLGTTTKTLTVTITSDD